MSAGLTHTNHICIKKPLDIHIDDSEIDDSTKPPIVNANDAIKSLKLVHSFLQQQEDYLNMLMLLIITLA